MKIGMLGGGRCHYSYATSIAACVQNSHNRGMKKKLLVLSAKTGGGHRAAALAVLEAFGHVKHDFEITHYDFVENAPRPIDDLPKYYKRITKIPPAYGSIFKATENSRQAKFASDTLARVYKNHLEKVIRHYDPDLILSFHFGANCIIPVLEGMGRNTPYITVVTDLATGHPWWFDSRTSACIVPSQEAYVRARTFGMPANKLHIVGLPINKQFASETRSKAEIRQALGWAEDIPIALVMAGGDGMGKVSSLTRRLDNSKTMPANLVVIAGRNSSLQKSLQKRNWNKHADVYGFRDDIADMMHAADVLLTKAGPGTIVEAMVSKLPIVVYDFLPGQEEGNLEYVVSNHAGVWASTSALAVRATTDILEGNVKIGGAVYDKTRQRHIDAANKIVEFVIKFPLDNVKE
jgi:1,2-diacylglycerol 3-beta-galactosyltransferase